MHGGISSQGGIPWGIMVWGIPLGIVFGTLCLESRWVVWGNQCPPRAHGVRDFHCFCNFSLELRFGLWQAREASKGEVEANDGRGQQATVEASKGAHLMPRPHPHHHPARRRWKRGLAQVGLLSRGALDQQNSDHHCPDRDRGHGLGHERVLRCRRLGTNSQKLV